jgi:outer membrane lipoprotein-sorting protein
MKLIRTASTRRLLAVLAGLIVAIAAGTAIAVAAQGPGPTPKPASLADALHHGLSAKAPTGITADITFTNNLIGSANFTGGPSDPILQGASGRLWISADGRLRLELQSSNGDAQIAVNQRSFWVSDPASNTVYEGTLPADTKGTPSTTGAKDTGIPSVAKIQSELSTLAAHLNVSGATPTDVAGQAAYSVSVSPKHDGGLLGSAQLAWDAARGIPLDFAVFARGNPTPVLELKATNISYGPVAASDFSVTPPAGSKVVKISTPPAASGATRANATKANATKANATKANAKRHADVSGVAAVAARVPFSFSPPATLAGLPRKTVSLLDWGGKPAALVAYGQGLGGIAVIEQTADAKSTPASGAQSGAPSTLSLPTVSINGATGQELDTALGTVVRFTSGGVAYTVLGSVPATAADLAARALTAK